MTKLSDTALVLLGNAAQNDDRFAEPPKHLPAAARNAVVRSLLKQGLLAAGFPEDRIDIIAGARVTDYFIEAKGFIALTDAEVWEIGGRQVCTSPFLNISRDHIQVIVPGSH